MAQVNQLKFGRNPRNKFGETRCHGRNVGRTTAGDNSSADTSRVGLTAAPFSGLHVANARCKQFISVSKPSKLQLTIH